MKTKQIWMLVVALSGLAFVTGCATTEARIEKNPQAFARLAPDQQELVKKGEVAIGFDEDAVKLALGEPDRVRTRTDARGTNEIWSYSNYDGPDGTLLYRGWYHRYYVWGDPLYPYYLNFPSRHERDRFRIAFTDGRVSSIEKESNAD
jgi:hypothetical protein